MKKFLLIFFTLISILPGEGSQAYTHTIHNSHLQQKSNSLQAVDGVLQHSRTFITSSSHSGSDKSFEIEATENEIEEDKLVPVKREFENSSVSKALLWALIVGYFSSYLKRGYVLFGHLSHSPSPRWFILFQVFRI